MTAQDLYKKELNKMERDLADKAKALSKFKYLEKKRKLLIHMFDNDYPSLVFEGDTVSTKHGDTGVVESIRGKDLWVRDKETLQVSPWNTGHITCISR